MAERVFKYANEPVRAVRVVARIGNKIVARTPIRHTQAPDGPVISFQRRWLLKREPTLTTATFHIVPASDQAALVQKKERGDRVIEEIALATPTERRANTRKTTTPNSLGIPDRIRNFSYLGWTNVFQLVLNNDHIYPVALDADWKLQFNDWNGRILLLAKDGCPTRVIRALRDNGEPRPWRFAQRDLGDKQGLKTNERLYRYASTIPGGKLYGSAAANMLHDDPKWSRLLKGFKSAELGAYFRFTLTWVLSSMKRVEWVACLGEDAWFLTCETLGDRAAAKNFKNYRDSHRSVTGKIGNKQITAFPMHHPSRGANDLLDREWRAFGDRLQNG